MISSGTLKKGGAFPMSFLLSKSEIFAHIASGRFEASVAIGNKERRKSEKWYF